MKIISSCNTEMPKRLFDTIQQHEHICHHSLSENYKLMKGRTSTSITTETIGILQIPLEAHGNKHMGYICSLSKPSNISPQKTYIQYDSFQ